ncbi:MAG: hypothetical protein JWO19_3743 [Bryobacterales bacterium]|nr:hypothetical protein [Bryobacterales bacterium]
MDSTIGWKSTGISGFKLFLLLSLMPLGQFAASGHISERPLLAAGTAKGTDEQSGILWRDPGDLRAHNLFYGIGGKQGAPPAQGYTFVKEDRGGSSPKFVVKDPKGVRWKVKLGPEARGEIAATRLVWAAGYFTDEDYYLPRLHVKNMPRLRRGKEFVSPEGVVENARMEREIEGEKKVGSWKWKSTHTSNRRAFNGLKVMMALVNNWDLKDNNTAIYKREYPGGAGEYIYAVSDLGASFGRTHLDRAETKASLQYYETSRFITKVGSEHVRFATPGSPTAFLLVNPADYFYRRGLMSVTREIPRADARWLGQLLSRLSRQQIRDAFRAGGFSPEETDGFARVMEQRIEVLRQL